MKPDIKPQVLNLKASGKGNLEISIAIGCTIRTVQRVLQECRLETAAQQADAIEKSIRHFQVTESKRTRSLCSGLRTVEQELATRSFADISTSQLLQMAFKLRHQVQKLEDRNEQLLEKAFKIHEKEFGSEETDYEIDRFDDRLSNQSSSSDGSTPVLPTPAPNVQPATATVQQPAPSTTSPKPTKTILTLLPDPMATPQSATKPCRELSEAKPLATLKALVPPQAPQTRSIPEPKSQETIPTTSPWPTTRKKFAIAPSAHDQYRTSSQVRANSAIQSAIKSIPSGKAAVAPSADPQSKGDPKPLVACMELTKPTLELAQPLAGSLRYNANLMEVALFRELEKQAA